MSIDAREEILIRCSVDAVAAYTADPAHDPIWIGGIKTARWVTEPPLQLGTQIARVAHFLGKKIEYIYEVDGLEPSKRLSMRSIEGPFPMTTAYEYAAAPDGAIMRIVVGGGDGGRFFKLTKGLMARAVRRNLRKDLRALKVIMEDKSTKG